MLTLLLKFLQHCVQPGIIEDAVEGPVVEVGDGRRSGVQSSQSTKAKSLTNRMSTMLCRWSPSYTGMRVKPSVQDLGDCRKIQHRVGAQHEAVPEGGQHLLHHFGAAAPGRPG